MFSSAKAQKRQLYFSIGPDVQFTSAVRYPSAIGVGATGQLSYWFNRKFVWIVNTGFIQFINGDEAVNKLSIPSKYFTIPLLTGLEYNLLDNMYLQLQVGNSFTKNVKIKNSADWRDNEVRNALTYNAAFGLRLSTHSDLLLKVNHTRFNTENRTASANNSAIGAAYMYNF